MGFKRAVQLGRSSSRVWRHVARVDEARVGDSVDERGFTLRYNSVKRFCRALRKREPEQFDRLEFLPGE